MIGNVKITINSKETFTGRLVGIIDHEDCRAIINTEDAARKIYSAETMPFDNIPTATNKRFIIATSDYSGDGIHREIFISASIRSMSYIKNGRIFKCGDNNEYKVEKL